MKSVHFLLFYLILPSFLFSQTFETNQFADLQKYANKDTIVLCDLDNTIMIADYQLGWTKWIDQQAEILEKKGMNQENTNVICSYLWMLVQSKMTVHPIQPNTVEVINKLQANGITVMGFSERETSEASNALIQLKSIDVDFTKTRYTPENVTLPFEHEILYQDGVLFCTHCNSKSKALLGYFKMVGKQPKKVIFIDDKWSHVHDVEKALEEAGISCIGIRYGGADEILKTYDEDVAKEQWDSFPVLISNKEAEALVRKHTHSQPPASEFNGN